MPKVSSGMNGEKFKGKQTNGQETKKLGEKEDILNESKWGTFLMCVDKQQ